MKVALVYDWVDKWGGAERILLALHKIWPQAPLFTSVYRRQSAPWARVFKIKPSFLNKLPLVGGGHEIYSGLMPMAFECFSFDDYDLVFSVTSALAKGVITKPSTRHICYCLTPTRFLWSGYADYFKNKWMRVLARPIVSYLRFWDQVAASRPDAYLAISKNVQKRIEKYLWRRSEVVYPPVDTEKFRILSSGLQGKGKFFLVVSRLVPYKKIDLVIKAFNQLKLPLKIVGTGREEAKLRRVAKKNVCFLGQLTDEQLLRYYQNCRAVVFPQEEDFGLVPLEAQACGRPVIAYRKGGALETVVEGKTGLFFERQTEEDLIRAVRKLERIEFDPIVCRQNALKFGQRRFRQQIEEWVKKY